MEWVRQRNHFLKTKARATLSAQAKIANVWTWSQKTLAQWETDIVALERLIPDEATKHLEWLTAQEALRNDIEKIKNFTGNFKHAGEVKFRHNPELRPLIHGLNMRLAKPRRIYQEALTAHSLWERADKTWEIDPGLTLAAFGEVLTVFPDRESAEAVLRAAWLPLVSDVGNRIYTLERDTAAWYTAATERFAAGTVEGDLIRSSVPAILPREQEKVGMAVISNLKVVANEIQFDCVAPGATHYTYLQQPPGSPMFVVVLADTADTHVTLRGQALGDHRFRAMGSNPNGQGPASEVVQVTVTAVANA